ncbi:MAG: GAF domain-containing protein, partial [Desulfobacteraceae bacterium]|nr:GAF domain-containing protein [Desulfobacteraceae bacterium]
VYIFFNDYERWISINTHEWCADGIKSEINNLQAVPLEDMTDIIETHQRGEPFIIPRVSDLPENDRIRMIIEPQDIRSLLLIPLIYFGEYLGYVGFDAVRKEIHFTETDLNLLTVFAELIVNVKMRQKTDAERVKLQDQLSQVQKAESLGRMAGSIAHHFNNQLSVVMGNLELVLNDLPDDAKNRENLFQAFEAANKAADQSKQMLRYLGHISGSKTTMNLSDICRQCLGLLQTSLPNGVTLNVDFPDSGPLVHADADQVQQVLTNLFTNAQESLPDNQGTIGLSIHTVSQEDISTSNRFPLDWQPQDIPYACLEISDTGSGISRKDIVKLFDPFYTTKFTGRGMGLPVTMGILKTHGGCIIVDSKSGRGSVFRVCLPVSAEKPPVTDEKVTTPKG